MFVLKGMLRDNPAAVPREAFLRRRDERLVPKPIAPISSEGEPGVVERSTICVDGSTIWIQNDDGLWDKIDDATKLFFILTQLSLRSLSLDRNYGDVTRAFNQSQISLARAARLRIVQAEGAKNFLVFGE